MKETDGVFYQEANLLRESFGISRERDNELIQLVMGRYRQGFSFAEVLIEMINGDSVTAAELVVLSWAMGALWQKSGEEFAGRYASRRHKAEGQ